MELVEVHIKGKVNTDWSSWLGGLKVNHTMDGDTILIGEVRDQSALIGILNRLSNLGIQLLSVTSRKMNNPVGNNEVLASPGSRGIVETGLKALDMKKIRRRDRKEKNRNSTRS